MYSERSRRVKTDRRDVAALADACHRGCYRAAHRRSPSQRTVQAQLNVRRELTDSRTRAVSQARAITRGAGLRIRSGSTGSFLVRVALDLPSSIAETLAPLQRLIAVLNDELATADDRFATIAAQDPVVARLTTVRALGPSPRRRTSPRSMTPHASVAQRRWRATWASCPASTVLASSSDGGG
jgi:transposase